MKPITSMQSQWQLQKLTGKNLFDYKNAKQYTKWFFSATSGKAKISTYSFDRLICVKIKHNTTYTISSKYCGTVSCGTYSSDTLLQDCSLNNYTEPLSLPVTISNTSDDYLFIQLWANDETICYIDSKTNGSNDNIIRDIVLSHVQVEEGTVATEYESYCGGTTDSLHFEQCKGGYFSTRDEYGLKVVGNTAQRTLTGKNLLNLDNIKQITYTNSSGNALQRYGVVINTPGTYTCSAKNSGNDDYIYAMLTDSGNNIIGSVAYLVVNNNVYTKTITVANGQNLLIYNASNTGTLNNTIDCFVKRCIMVKYGNVATDYEPYCGGVPSPNPDYPQEIQCIKSGAKIKVCGKNLLSNSANLSISSKVRDITIQPGDYILSVYNTDGSTDGYIRDTTYSALFRDANNNNVTYVQRYAHITSDMADKIAKIVININPSYYTGNDSKMCVQLERGDTATPYEPYISGGEIIVPCDLYDGDVWYPATGRVERNTAYCELALSGAAVKAYGSYNRYTLPFDAAVVNDAAYSKCTHIGGYLFSENESTHYYCAGSAAYLFVPNDTDTSITVGALARRRQAIIEQYDPQPIFAPKGTVNVIQSSVDLHATLSASHLVRRHSNSISSINNNDISNYTLNSLASSIDSDVLYVSKNNLDNNNNTEIDNAIKSAQNCIVQNIENNILSVNVNNINNDIIQDINNDINADIIDNILTITK